MSRVDVCVYGPGELPLWSEVVEGDPVVVQPDTLFVTTFTPNVPCVTDTWSATTGFTDNGDGTWTSSVPVDNGNGTWSM